VFLARTSAAVAGAVSTGAVGIGMVNALGPPDLLRIPIRLRKLDPAFTGYRIAVVSDIHLGPISGRTHTERIVRMINETSPDLVAIVGDLVDGTVDELGPAAAPLRDLVSRDGAFFVTGNHEYFSGDPAAWLRELERLGVQPLRNENTAIGTAFDLAGVNDLSGRSTDGGPGLQQGALAGLSTVDRTQLYVTRGAGFWGPPVRVGAPPDITVLSLQSAD
jgi:predicted MPP superfamily phosphohydrolase